MKFQSHERGRMLRGRKASGFTLVEILVVLAIIAILAALLFPAFKSAQEKGKQANCTSNLQQIYTAVRLYYDDEKKYPMNASVLLPNTEKLDNSIPTPAIMINGVKDSCDTATKTCINVRGAGYLKSTSALVCPDDDTDSAGKPRSSYTNVATGISGTPADTTADFGRYVWNYWGYKEDGFAYDKEDDAYFGDAGQTTSIAGDKRYWRDGITATATDFSQIDRLKLPRLANRQAPADTIITHCVFHRLPTSNIAKPTDIYTDTANAPGSADIVLRLDGTASLADVTTWKGEKWIKQIR